MKKLICVMLTLVILFGTAACASTTLPEGFDSDELLSDAENVAALLSERDFEAVTAMFDPVMASLDASALEEGMNPTLDALGAFESVKNSAFTSGSDSAIGQYATVILVCTHENGSATYTISFTESGEICGLYLK